MNHGRPLDPYQGLSLRLATHYGRSGLSGFQEVTRALSAATARGRVEIDLPDLFEPPTWSAWLTRFPAILGEDCDGGWREGGERDCDGGAA